MFCGFSLASMPGWCMCTSMCVCMHACVCLRERTREREREKERERKKERESAHACVRACVRACKCMSPSTADFSLSLSLLIDIEQKVVADRYGRGD